MILPDDVKWFISSEVQECAIHGHPEKTVWVNHRLIRASSFDEAYKRAMEFGKAEEDTYLNADKEQVTWRFRGLQDLQPLFDALEDGAELIFDSYDDQTEQQILRRLHSKQEIWDRLNAEQSDRETQALIDTEFKKLVDES